jgi:hypothetical protein
MTGTSYKYTYLHRVMIRSTGKRKVHPAFNQYLFHAILQSINHICARKHTRQLTREYISVPLHVLI